MLTIATAIFDLFTDSADSEEVTLSDISTSLSSFDAGWRRYPKGAERAHRFSGDKLTSIHGVLFCDGRFLSLYECVTLMDLGTKIDGSFPGRWEGVVPVQVEFAKFMGFTDGVTSWNGANIVTDGTD